MQIDRNIKPAKKEITWLKQFSSGVSFKKLYKKDKRGEIKPSSYHKLFIHFYNNDMGEGVSGRTLRIDCGWRFNTHSDYFALFTMNKVLTYDKSKRVYVRGENFQAYFDHAQEQYTEVRCK